MEHDSEYQRQALQRRNVSIPNHSRYSRFDFLPGQGVTNSTAAPMSFFATVRWMRATISTSDQTDYPISPHFGATSLEDRWAGP